jgi:tetratricopeptide (TPR) repeat protein
MKIKLLSIVFLLGFLPAIACTVYKITKNGKTFVGNNEDYWDANTRLWFEKGKTDEYGSMFVGLDNLVPQGGMNEKGLIFDGFSVQQRQIKEKAGKLKFYHTLFKDVMKKCQNTVEVYNMLDKYDMSILNGGMLLYVEKSGKYLVVEADTMIMGNQDSYLLSNFCPSQTTNVEELNIPYYQKGRKMLEQHTDTSLSYLTLLSDTMHQDCGKGFGGTLYTTIYDLNEGTVNLYFYHDYSVTVKFNLKDELNKKDRILVIPEMFHENTAGQFHYSKYNNAKEAIRSLARNVAANDSLALDNFIEAEELYPMIKVFEVDVNDVGYALLEKGKITVAINVFKLNVKYFPKSWNCYDSLGEAYMKAEEYSLALLNYKRSVEMNPENEPGQDQIRKIEKRRKR